MSDPEKEIVFRPLHESPIVSVHDYCCHIARGGPGAEEESNANNIVLMRHGAFSRHFGRKRVTADVNQAVFFSRDSTYRVSHPTECGDRGTIFTVSPRVLNDIVRELDPSIDEHPDQPFLFATGPCDSRVFWRHRELVQIVTSLTLSGASSAIRHRKCERNKQDSGSRDFRSLLLCPRWLNSSKGDKVMNTSKCPVCDWAINDGGIKVTVAGKEITVCCDECVEKAKANPAQYAGVE